MPAVRVKPETYAVLNQLKGFLMEQEKENQSHDDVINWLFMVAKPHRQDFPYWPLFQEKQKTLEDRKEKFWKGFKQPKQPR